MSDPQPDSRYVSGDRPVNRRTQAVAPRQDQGLSAEAERRAARLQRIHQSASNRTLPSSAPAPARVPAAALVSGLMGIALLSAAGLALQGVLKGSAVAAALLCFGVAAAMLLRERRHQRQLAASTALLEPALLDALDERIGEAMQTLPTELAEALAQVQAALARTLPLAGELDTEDRLYLREAARRYLPDTLEAFFKIPSGHRDRQNQDGGPTPSMALKVQLQLLAQEFERRETKAAALVAEALARQQRFLEQKRSG